MKKIFSIIALVVAFAGFSSCEKDEGKLPNISIKTGAGYTSADLILAPNTTVTMGITASKAEDKDVLKTFDASKSINGAAAVSFYSESLTGATGDNYSKDLTITTGAVAQTEKYTFTVVNRDGLKNSVSVTVTVQ